MAGYYFSTTKHKLPTVSSTKYLKRRCSGTWVESTSNVGSFGLSSTKKFTLDNGILLVDGLIKNDELLHQLSDNLDDSIELIRSLSGEFSLVWSTEKFTIFCTDVWGGRPLYYNNNEDFLFLSTLPNVVQEVYGHFYRCFEEYIYVYDKYANSIKMHPHKEWDLDQKINHFDYVFEAWENAVKSRYVTDQSSIFLSGGHDSGMIALTVSKLFNDVDCYYAYSGKENDTVMQGRKEYHGFQTMYLQKELQHKNEKPLMYDTWNVLNDPLTMRVRPLAVSDDTWSYYSFSNNIMFEVYHNHMLPKGKRYMFYGRGADELYSDDAYPGNYHSNWSSFGGFFPRDLSLIIPRIGDLEHRVSWKINWRYDKIAGFFGINSRFPFYDRDLYQAFLNTTQDLKNREYKSWMSEYMRQHDYPHNDMKKDYSLKMGFYSPEENQLKSDELFEDVTF